MSQQGSFYVLGKDIEHPEKLSREDKQLFDQFKVLRGADRDAFLEKLRDQNFSREDLDILSGRRSGWEVFRAKLYDDKSWTELQWQNFFQENQWIFGYGLDYRFLSILNKEAHVANAELDGSGGAKADFLAGATDFTVLIELKLPSTEISRGSSPQRAGAWGLATPLMDAVSQILAQKAAWQIKSQERHHYDDTGSRIRQGTTDPKAILVVGMQSAFDETDQASEIKLSTFELFRRDSRNIEILTYDELYDRAFYIVNQRLPSNADREHSSGEEVPDERPIENYHKPAVADWDDIPF